MATPPSPAPDHLCVLVHGLWGSPHHLDFMASSLRERYGDELHVLVPKSNAGTFTYDGIETGAERVTNEIEAALDDLERRGQPITKLSVVGYSLGGLVARFAIGLLYYRGWFRKLQPMNFVTFATPHLGGRSPLRGMYNTLWNVAASRILALSGRQLFLTDSFRDTGRPLLAVLADVDSIFMRALAQFRHRSLYANVVNDRSVPFHTAAISSTDPFGDLNAVDIHYLPGWDQVILDPDQAASPKPRSSRAFFPRSSPSAFLRQLAMVVIPFMILPVGLTIAVMTGVVQSGRSHKRVLLHQSGKTGVDVKGYRIPETLIGVRQKLEGYVESTANAPMPHEALAGSWSHSHESPSISLSTTDCENNSSGPREFPTLALTPEQFAMLDALDGVGFRKYPVYIHNHGHTHAAVIMRSQKRWFDEGKVVIRHFVKEFQVQ